MKVDYCCNQSRILSHYQTQAGKGFAYFKGGRQKGSGFGSIFRTIGRAVLPLVSRGAKALGKQALSTGLQIAQDVAGGSSFKEAAVTRGKEAGRSLLNRAISRKRSAATALPVANIKRRKTRKGGSRKAKRPRDIFDG